MIRLFEQHQIRTQKELDGMWQVTVGEKEYLLPVPGCWEQHPELLTYRGKAVYRRKIQVGRQTNVRLEFKGVSHTADVYFDENKVAHHYNAFTAFSAIVEGVEPGEHEIRVEVDNSFSEASALHVPNDYYTYGGLIRPVVYEEIGAVYVKNVHFLPKKEAGVWKAVITAELENLAEESFRGEIACEAAGKTVSQRVEIEGKTAKKFSLEEKYEQAEAWEVLAPKLYLLKTTLLSEGGELLDDLTDRVGFREAAISGRDFLVNGKKVFLKGFNRHEDYGTLGCAVPFQVMNQDMDMMLEVGSNAVRTCHIPMMRDFLTFVMSGE